MLISSRKTTKMALLARQLRPRYKDMDVFTQDAERLTNIILIKCRSHSNVNTQKIWRKVGKGVGKGSLPHTSGIPVAASR